MVDAAKNGKRISLTFPAVRSISSFRKSNQLNQLKYIIIKILDKLTMFLYTSIESIEVRCMFNHLPCFSKVMYSDFRATYYKVVSLKPIVTMEAIEQKILLIRGQKVMLDSELAVLYGVPTKVLLQAVRRNVKRFPQDFAFQLENHDVVVLRSQSVTSSLGHGGQRYKPYVFTEQGVAMLSSVLNSDRAIEVNILIMRAFVQLREMIATHKDLARKLEEIENKFDSQFKIVFDAIRALIAQPEPKERKIGFIKENVAHYRAAAKGLI